MRLAVERTGFLLVIRFGLKRIMNKKAKGKPHKSIIKSLSFQWIMIVFGCCKTNTPNGELTYLTVLKSKGVTTVKICNGKWALVHTVHLKACC